MFGPWLQKPVSDRVGCDEPLYLGVPPADEPPSSSFGYGKWPSWERGCLSQRELWLRRGTTAGGARPYPGAAPRDAAFEGLVRDFGHCIVKDSKATVPKLKAYLKERCFCTTGNRKVLCVRVAIAEAGEFMMRRDLIEIETQRASRYKHLVLVVPSSVADTWACDNVESKAPRLQSHAAAVDVRADWSCLPSEVLHLILKLALTHSCSYEVVCVSHGTVYGEAAECAATGGVDDTPNGESDFSFLPNWQDSIPHRSVSEQAQYEKLQATPSLQAELCSARNRVRQTRATWRASECALRELAKKAAFYVEVPSAYGSAFAQTWEMDNRLVKQADGEWACVHLLWLPPPYSCLPSSRSCGGVSAADTCEWR